MSHYEYYITSPPPLRVWDCNDYIPLRTSVVIIGLISIPLVDRLLPRGVVDEGVQTVSPTFTIKVDECVQTVSQTIKVDECVQTSSLPQVVTQVDSMAEYPLIECPVMEPTVLPNPLINNEIGVQTSYDSLFDLIKTWLKKYLILTLNK